jgi:hypothetical protein
MTTICTNPTDKLRTTKTESKKKYYGKETSKWDKEADTNSSKRWQGNRVTVSGDEYNLRESDKRTTNDYDRKQAITRKYYGEETSKCDEEADGNCFKRRQGNRVTMSGDDYNLCKSDQRNKNDCDRKQASTRKYYGKETTDIQAGINDLHQRRHVGLV